MLTTEGTVTVLAHQAAKFLVLAAKPIREPIVQYGPFVMNSMTEIEQAIRDYQQGTLTSGQAAATINLHQ